MASGVVAVHGANSKQSRPGGAYGDGRDGPGLAGRRDRRPAPLVSEAGAPTGRELDIAAFMRKRAFLTRRRALARRSLSESSPPSPTRSAP